MSLVHTIISGYVCAGRYLSKPNWVRVTGVPNYSRPTRIGGVESRSGYDVGRNNTPLFDIYLICHVVTCVSCAKRLLETGPTLHFGEIKRYPKGDSPLDFFVFAFGSTWSRWQAGSSSL